MKRPIILLALFFAPVLVTLAVIGCSSVVTSPPAPDRVVSYKLTLYSGGFAVKTWNAKGQVQCDFHPDSYYFVDIATGKLVRVAGTVVIEQLP